MDNKNIIRVEKNKDYVVINRTVLNDKKLSWKAKGLMAYMLAMPDDWVFYLEELETHSTDKEASFRSGFNELKKQGYVNRKRDRLSDGTFEWRTIVYEIPLSENPQVDNPQVDKPQVDNRELLSTDELSTEELNIDKEIPSFPKEQEIFDHYMTKDLIQHQKFTRPMKSQVKTALKKMSVDKLKKIIDNCAAIYHDNKYYFNSKYSLVKILREKDLQQFSDEEEPFYNFLRDKTSKVSSEKKYDKGYKEMTYEEMVEKGMI